MRKLARVVLVAFAASVLGAGIVLAADRELEMIEDLDLGFFIRSPKATWAGDPFERLPGFGPALDEKIDEYVLNGIVYSDQAPVATINNANVRIGDRVGRRVVTEIGENYVVLKRGGSEIELTLPTVSRDWESEARNLAGEESE